MRFSAVPEVKRRKCIEAGCPIILQCEISDSTAQVQWYKDGDQLLVESGVDIKSDDCMRTLSIQSAHPSHAGVYSCTTKDDVIKFHVEIRGDLPSLFLTYKLTVCLLAITPLTITAFCVALLSQSLVTFQRFFVVKYLSPFFFSFSFTILDDLFSHYVLVVAVVTVLVILKQ